MRAVIFDWGGTLTPWHDIDVRGLWRAVLGVYAGPDSVEELADRLIAAEADLWARAAHRRRGLHQ